MTFYCYDVRAKIMYFYFFFFAFLTVNSWYFNKIVSLQSLSSHLGEKQVEYCAVSSPPVLSADQNNDIEGLSYQLGSTYKMWRDIIRGATIVLTSNGSSILSGEAESSFFLKKMKITRDHRRECYSLIERIFGDGPSLDRDLIVINSFALVF